MPGRPFGPPTQPAALDEESAVAAARATLSPELFTHPYTVQYGSMVNPIQRRDPDAGKLSSPELIDVWKIEISGIVIPRFGGRRRPRKEPLPPSTLTVYVNDKTGMYVMAEE